MFPSCPGDFRLSELWPDGPDDAFRDAVLELKNIVEGAVEAFRSQMIAGCCLDQLRRDTNAVVGLAHTPFQ